MSVRTVNSSGRPTANDFFSSFPTTSPSNNSFTSNASPFATPSSNVVTPTRLNANQSQDIAGVFSGAEATRAFDDDGQGYRPEEEFPGALTPTDIDVTAPEAPDLSALLGYSDGSLSLSPSPLATASTTTDTFMTPFAQPTPSPSPAFDTFANTTPDTTYPTTTQPSNASNPFGMDNSDLDFLFSAPSPAPSLNTSSPSLNAAFYSPPAPTNPPFVSQSPPLQNDAFRPTSSPFSDLSSSVTAFTPSPPLQAPTANDFWQSLSTTTTTTTTTPTPTTSGKPECKVPLLYFERCDQGNNDGVYRNTSMPTQAMSCVAKQATAPRTILDIIPDRRFIAREPLRVRLLLLNDRSYGIIELEGFAPIEQLLSSTGGGRMCRESETLIVRTATCGGDGNIDQKNLTPVAHAISIDGRFNDALFLLLAYRIVRFTELAMAQALCLLEAAVALDVPITLDMIEAIAELVQSADELFLFLGHVQRDFDRLLCPKASARVSVEQFAETIQPLIEVIGKHAFARMVNMYDSPCLFTHLLLAVVFSWPVRTVLATGMADPKNSSTGTFDLRLMVSNSSSALTTAATESFASNNKRVGHSWKMTLEWKSALLEELSRRLAEKRVALQRESVGALLVSLGVPLIELANRWYQAPSTMSHNFEPVSLQDICLSEEHRAPELVLQFYKVMERDTLQAVRQRVLQLLMAWFRYKKLPSHLRVETADSTADAVRRMTGGSIDVCTLADISRTNRMAVVQWDNFEWWAKGKMFVHRPPTDSEELAEVPMDERITINGRPYQICGQREFRRLNQTWTRLVVTLSSDDVNWLLGFTGLARRVAAWMTGRAPCPDEEILRVIKWPLPSFSTVYDNESRPGTAPSMSIALDADLIFLAVLNDPVVADRLFRVTFM